MGMRSIDIRLVSDSQRVTPVAAAQCQERSLVTVGAPPVKIYVGETMAANFVVITSINIVGGT